MVRRIAIRVLLAVWVIVLVVAVYKIQDRQIAKLQYARPYRDTLNMPPPRQSKLLAFGYDEMLASILWLRSIQAFGAKLHHLRENPRELRAIENLFYVITELDPRFVEVYQFGNLVLGDEGGDQEAALRLIDRGIVKNLNRTYKLPYEAVFICLEMDDYNRARHYVHFALKAPDCPDYVRRVEYYVIAKKGHYEIALERWVRDDLDSFYNHRPQVHDIARSQIAHIVNEWHISIIDAAIDRYFERHKDYPARLEQLEQEGLIGKVRQVNGPLLIQLLDGAEAAHIPTEQAVAMIMGSRNRPGCIFESDRLPRDIHGQPYLLVDATRIPVQKRPVVIDRDTMRKETRMALFAIRRRIQGFYKKHGRYPRTLSELPQMKAGSLERLYEEDPAGMPWNYDPKTGKVKSYVFPKL